MAAYKGSRREILRREASRREASRREILRREALRRKALRRKTSRGVYIMGSRDSSIEVLSYYYR